MVEKSASTPWLPAPANLKGYAGEETQFDPLGFSNKYSMLWLREAELKHGRVCMLAILGWVSVDVGFTLPKFAGMSSFEVAQDSFAKAPEAWLIALLVGTFESTVGLEKTKNMGGVWETEPEAAPSMEGKPGEYDFDPMSMFNVDPARQAKFRMQELKHGRLAMLAFAGIVAQSMVADGPLPFPYGFEGKLYSPFNFLDVLV